MAELGEEMASSLRKSLKDLCLTFHCLSDGDTSLLTTNSSLFIEKDDIEELVLSLKEMGYQFIRPHEKSHPEGPKCAITFDDGYYNNHLFLDIANRHKIPFTLFLTTYNTKSGAPYIWDVLSAKNIEWQFWKDDYEGFYQQHKDWPEHLNNAPYRPFTLDELLSISTNKLLTISPHTHFHQPLVGRSLEQLDADFKINCGYIQEHFPNSVLTDLALPCGLLSGKATSYLKRKFERIYTISGGGCNFSSQFIDRISLINPEVGGPLLEQIEKSFSIRRRIATTIHRTRFLYT